MTSTTDERPAAASASNSGAGAEAGGRIPAARQAFESARERTVAAYAAARDRAGSAYETAGRRAGDGIDANPVAAVVGGLAIGAIVAAMLPRTRREDELLGTVGRQINDSAREAARAAREAGKTQLDELGLSRDGIRGRLDEFTGRAVGAVKSSADAAAGSVRTKKKG
jgi:tRNA(Met) C34 N-acetyltransferase TmcA